MSTCISRHGEFSDHVPDENFVCRRCFVLDEEALVADRDKWRARAEAAEARIRGEAAECFDSGIAIISVSIADGQALVKTGALSARAQVTYVTPRSRNATRGRIFDAVLITAGAAFHPRLSELLREVAPGLRRRDPLLVERDRLRREWLRKIEAGRDSIPPEHPEG